MADDSRLQRLLAIARVPNGIANHGSGIRGLRLNLAFLRAKGAKPEFLKKWQHGRSLEVTPAAPSLQSPVPGAALFC